MMSIGSMALAPLGLGPVGPAMHIPDGYMSVPVAIAGWVVTVGVVAYAARRAEREISDRAVPLMGVMAAFIFATQMMNFPVAGGTSGHLLGGALAAILLGPWAAVIVMAAVVGLQALMFQDGGLVVMGLNIANMGILTIFAGYFVYRFLAGVIPGRVGALAASFVAAWASVVIGSAVVAVELALSGASPLGVALPAMIGVHALIGVGEGLITLAAVSFIRATNPGLVPTPGLAPAGLNGAAR